MSGDGTWLRRRKNERPQLRLAPVWVALAGTFTVAISVAAVALWTGLQLLHVHELKTERQLTSNTLFDLVKVAFAIVAGIGGLVALVVSYRRQRIDEAGALRETTKLHSERFTAAVGQLGDDTPAVRLGGVHALAGLADDAPTRQLRQTCIDVLCAYLRLPYEPDPGDQAPIERQQTYRAFREVRHTVVRVIGNHLHTNATVPWHGHDFDFTDVVFDGGDLQGAIFSGGKAIFKAAEFSDGTTSFEDARFTGGRVDFTNAKFTGGRVDFTNGKFTGGRVDFANAEFTGGAVDFGRATFDGGTVSFTGTTFSGGTVAFKQAMFLDGRVGFLSATFSGGTLSFRAARFSGSLVNFWNASFCGSTVDFRTASFPHGMVRFTDTTFSDGTVDFSDAKFTDPAHAIMVDDWKTKFSGITVTFGDVTFSGGTVDFRNARGTPPQGIIPEVGEPVPQGIKLSTQWTPEGTGR
jgi:uncharacterized protein YjbI with pentapeptide repeats